MSLFGREIDWEAVERAMTKPPAVTYDLRSDTVTMSRADYDRLRANSRRPL